MATMSVNLPAYMIGLVENEVAEGAHASSSEVVSDALQLLQHDKAFESEKLAILRREIHIGLDDATAGRRSAKSVSDIADEIRREHFEK